MADPKPCPFCGESLAHVQPRREGDDLYQHPRNACVLATVGMGDPLIVFDFPEDVARWNRRATDGVPDRLTSPDSKSNNTEK
jgi:hypothetical protein